MRGDEQEFLPCLGDGRRYLDFSWHVALLIIMNVRVVDEAWSGTVMTKNAQCNEKCRQSTTVGGDDGPSMRTWLATLEAAGQLHRIDALTDWDQEIAGIARVNISQGGPALLFQNIKDYQTGPCTKFMTCGISNNTQVALLLGLPVEATPKAMIQHLKSRYGSQIAPRLVTSGPVKENILRGKDIDLYKFPAPRWHYMDGGRYIDTFAAVVTKDPDTQIPNVGIYRGQLLAANKIGKLIVPTQGWGQHFLKRRQSRKPMPVAVVYGWHDVLPFCAASPFPKNISEWDMMGALLGQPVDLVKCETVDLEVPASAEIVVEGYVDPDPASYAMEGPFSEYPGYSGGTSSPKPVLEVTCITHRGDPILRGALEGARPGFPSEDLPLVCLSWSAIAWNMLDSMGVAGVTDVWIPPVTTGTHIIVQIHKSYRGHAQQVASVLWGWNIAMFAFKQVIVVEEDIDIRDPEAIEWAIAYRVNAEEGGIVTYGPTYGSPLDPSTRADLRDGKKYGSGKWTRVLIDATRNWEFEPNAENGNRRFPPVSRLPVRLERKLKKRWKEYGIGVPYLSEEKRELLTFEKLAKILPEV